MEHSLYPITPAPHHALSTSSETPPPGSASPVTPPASLALVPSPRNAPPASTQQMQT